MKFLVVDKNSIFQKFPPPKNIYHKVNWVSHQRGDISDVVAGLIATRWYQGTAYPGQAEGITDSSHDDLTYSTNIGPKHFSVDSRFYRSFCLNYRQITRSPAIFPCPLRWGSSARLPDVITKARTMMIGFACSKILRKVLSLWDSWRIKLDAWTPMTGEGRCRHRRAACLICFSGQKYSPLNLSNDEVTLPSYNTQYARWPRDLGHVSLSMHS